MIGLTVTPTMPSRSARLSASLVASSMVRRMLQRQRILPWQLTTPSEKKPCSSWTMTKLIRSPC